MDKSTIKFRNGVEIPILGFGTSRTKQQNVNDQLCLDCIKHALKIGYRHIDTAKRYNNEHIVRKAIQETKIKRDEIFLTTKLYGDDFGYEKALLAFEKACKQLHVNYLDLYLIHFPILPGKKQSYDEAKSLRLETWKALEELYNQGKCKVIGVSNYMPNHIQEIIDANMTIPFVNQCEFHPYYTNKEVFEFCRKHEIVFEGYCPLAKGEIINDETIKMLAQKYNRTPAQIAIRWSLQNNVVTIPCSWNFNRIEENFNVNNFNLEAQDIELLWSLNKNLKCSWDPTNVL